ncbi:MAG: PIN domain-containing protein [Oscillospiraceae bacterium]|nr:PIN domain-containing protein [Oscillospiraceae bacterium]
MTYSLDTNIIAALLRGDDKVTKRWRYERTQGNQSIISIIVYYETKRGLVASGATTKLQAFNRLFSVLGVEPLTIADVEAASLIYAERKKQGKPMEDTDLLIAAQAVARKHTLVTNNTKHFDNIQDLIIKDWI